jgi:hypothetical protein
LTNVSSTQQRIELLREIPAGAVPINRNGKHAFATKTIFITVESYSTWRDEYYFYFPALGLYNHYPVHIAKTQRVIAHGVPSQVEVVKASTAPPGTSSYIHPPTVIDFS